MGDICMYFILYVRKVYYNMVLRIFILFNFLDIIFLSLVIDNF